MPPFYLLPLFILTFLFNVTLANFDLWRMHGQQDSKETPWGFQPDGWMTFFDDPRTCDDVHPWAFWWERPDVSGNKLGVVCERERWKSGCYVNEWPWPYITRLEMHFCRDPDYHFTIYKSKGRQEGDTWYWTLFDVANNKKGECFAYGGASWDCWWDGFKDMPWLKKRHMWATRKFRCLTEYNPSDFEACHPRPEPGGKFAPSGEWANGTSAMKNESVVGEGSQGYVMRT